LQKFRLLFPEDIRERYAELIFKIIFNQRMPSLQDAIAGSGRSRGQFRTNLNVLISYDVAEVNFYTPGLYCLVFSGENAGFSLHDTG
jgi:hypothetical protein